MKNRLTVVVGILTLMLFALANVSGQEDAHGAEVSSGVARISLIHGDVSTQRGDSGDWAAAALNQPIMSSDKVSTGVRSRTEVQLDQANILRLGDNTLTTVAGLTRTQIQVQVARGLVDYTVFKGSEADVEIDTANVAIHPARADGIYRVEVNSEGETQIVVRRGEAEISTPQGSTHLEKGRMMIVRGTAEEAQFKEEEAPSKDSWDSWNYDRDRSILDAQSWRHTNRYYVGSEDLDAYGRWETSPITVRFGCPRLREAGRLIAPAAGCGSRDGVGPGFLMNLGAGRHITMAAGLCTTARGFGGLVRCMAIPDTGLCGRLPMCRSSVLAAA